MGRAAQKKIAARSQFVNGVAYPYRIKSAAGAWGFVAKIVTGPEVPAFIREGVKESILVDYSPITNFITVKNPYAIDPWKDFSVLTPMYPQMFFYSRDSQLYSLFGLRHWGFYTTVITDLQDAERQELCERFKTGNEELLPEHIGALLQIYVILEAENRERGIIRVQGDTFAWKVLLTPQGKMLCYIECPGAKVVEEKGNDAEFMKQFRFACTQYLATLWPALEALHDERYALFEVDATGEWCVPRHHIPLVPYGLKEKEEN